MKFYSSCARRPLQGSAAARGAGSVQDNTQAISAKIANIPFKHRQDELRDTGVKLPHERADTNRANDQPAIVRQGGDETAR